MSSMLAIARFLVRDEFAWGLIGFISVFAIISWIVLQVQSGRVVAALRDATRLVESASDKTSFAVGFEELSAQLERSRILGHPWSEFLETLVPRHLWDRNEVANTVQPGTHFQLGPLQEGTVSRRYYSAVPNLLVGFGLLFTFVGLAAGISLSSSALTAAPSGSGLSASVTDAFGSLLGGAFLSFGKSAAGIFWSIVFGLLDGREQSQSEKALAGFTRALEARLTLVTPERLALEQLASAREQTRSSREQAEAHLAMVRELASLLSRQLEANREQTARLTEISGSLAEQTELAQHSLSATQKHSVQAGSFYTASASTLQSLSGQFEKQLVEAREQTKQLKLFSTDLATNISGALETALERRISENLAPKLQQVIGELSAIRADRGASNNEVLQGMVSEFKQSLSGAAGTEMAGMAQALADLRVSLTEAAAAMNMANDRAAATSSKMSSDVEVTLTMTQDVLKSQTETLSELMRSIAAESGNSVSASIERATTGMMRTLETSNAASAAATAQLTDFVQTTRAALDAQLQAMTRMIDQASTASRDVVRDHLALAGQELARGTQQQSAVLGESVSALQSVTESWNLLLERTHKVLERAGTTAQSFEATGPQFAAITTNLAQTAQTLSGTHGQLVAHAEAASRAIASMQAAGAGIETSIQASRESWASYEKRFAGVDASLSETFKTLDEGLTKYAADVRRYLSEVDKSLGEAVGNLASTISPLSEDLASLPDEIRRFAAAVDRLGPQLERAAKRP